MENTERKEIIRRLLQEGLRLPEIQNYLIKEKGDSITYMELRLLIAEMQDVQLPAESSSKFAEPPAVAPPAAKTASPTAKGQPPQKGKPLAPAAQPATLQKTTVTVDSVVRAGAALSGHVNFSSGASADWFIDAYGRVGLDPAAGSSRPSPQDLQEFQSELHRMLTEEQGRF